MLGGQHNAGGLGRAIVRAALQEQRPLRAAGGGKGHRWHGVIQELGDPLGIGLGSARRSGTAPPAARRTRGTAAPTRSRPARRRWRGWDKSRVARLRPVGGDEVGHEPSAHQDPAFELAGVFRHFVVALVGHQHRRHRDLAGSWRGPGFWKADERHVPRLDHLDLRPIELPTAAERKRFEPRVGDAEVGELLLGPVHGAKVCRRPREPWAEDRGDGVEQRDHMRSVQPLGANLGQHRRVEPFLRQSSGRGEPADRDHEKTVLHGVLRAKGSVRALG